MKIIRISEALAKTGFTRTPLYESVTRGLFTRPVKLGGARACGWPEHEVDAIISARAAGAADNEVKRLVEDLHDARSVHCRNARAIALNHRDDPRQDKSLRQHEGAKQ